MSNSCTITFDTRGHGHGLYTELVDLHSLGPLRIRRATHIEFSNEQQLWQVQDVDGGPVLYESASRQDCLDWEQDYFAENTANTGKEKEDDAVCA